MAKFKIWQVRRIARTVSYHSRDAIEARFEGIETLHRLSISSPDGTASSATVQLDGNTVFCSAVKLEMEAGKGNVATITIPFIEVEFDADVEVRKIRY